MTVLTSQQSPAAAVIAEARWWLEHAVREEPPGSNRGVQVDFLNWYALPEGWGRPFPEGMTAAPWCASLVHAVGRLALGRAWPVPRTPSVQRIAEWAAAKLVLKPWPELPAAGDLVILWYARLKRYGHVGIITMVQESGDGTHVRTIEGNTGAGEREGWGVLEQRRAWRDGLAAVRWTEAL